ncbi:hypothetical protein PILCRDRAFT_11708 [Piloderma croceum F 1598]|uniref:Uncharacterized protein n=1 Tax=Piloderma croceum (strain F 1598) TaxID=765440 RepID=A0A0C3AV27_PILCF|nr:hypothetical protein PILCRDRAFT_11708 [Piloderma croceum F 1598]
MNDEDVFLEQDVDLNYLTHLRQHAQKTRLHLQGLDPSPLQPFYTESPASYWTSAEKSAFFHALSIHSRLRPDLIAECVKTKNAVDICAYIDMLEDGARIEGSGVNRSEMEAAMEVSDKWIELEEEKATAIIGHERKWEAEAAKIARDREIKVKKPPKAKKGEAKSAEERKRERVEFRLWRKEQHRQWNKEDIMRSMGVAHLKVIDNLLREEEETQAATATSRQNTVEPPPVPSDEEMIDPVLRSNPMPTPGLSTSTPPVEPVSSAIPSPLSPASRRRLQKRLYMRRKRAEATGRTELLSVEGSTVVQRGKPGRKSKPRKKRKTEEGDAVVDDDQEDDEEEEEDARHSHIGGKTRHYKIKGLLESTDMDAETLDKNGLGLFHLSALFKLMRMYNLLHNVGPDVSTEISADAVQFLHAHVVRYVTELIRRAIVSREQERDMKAHTKVWRFNSEQVLSATIDHAMQLAGTTSIGTKESIIEGVFERLDVLSAEVASDADVSGEEEDDQSAEDDALAGAKDQEIVAPTFNLHQGMYVPLIRLPGSSKEDYGYQRTSFEPEEPLLPLTTDEEALAAELLQEEELDVQDGIVAEKDENRLWGEYSRRSNRAAAAVARDDEQDGNELRLKAPGLDGPVKSQVYVIDSDTE